MSDHVCTLERFRVENAPAWIYTVRVAETSGTVLATVARYVPDTDLETEEAWQAVCAAVRQMQIDVWQAAGLSGTRNPDEDATFEADMIRRANEGLA